MAEKYVEAILAALQEYQPGLPLEVYSDLAWGGLRETPIFDETFHTGDPRIERINNRYICEGVGHEYLGQTPVGLNCN